MRTMIDLGSQRGPIVLNIMDTATSVDCGRQVRFRRTFRSLVECMVPACCGFQPTLSDSASLSSSSSSSTDSNNFSNSFNSSTTTTTTTHTHASTVTGTFFGFRRGRVSFCLQDDPKNPPLLLLELGIPTSYLAKEMQYGLLRIALVGCERFSNQKTDSGSGSLFGVFLWSVFFNGKKVGFASRRQATAGDVAVLKLMQSVSVGAGELPAVGGVEGEDEGKNYDQMMYLRARFERVGSVDSESFHMINPDGRGSGQELSIFLLRY